MEIIEEIKTLELKSVEELYEILEEQLLATTLATSKFSNEEKREEARNWAKQQELKLRKLIYESTIYKIYIANPKNWDWMLVIAALTDIITPFVIGVSPLTLAALLLKKGLDTQQPEIENDRPDPLIGLFESSPDLAMRSEEILQQDITEQSGWTWKETQQ
jgi:hypothetical protein